jgi:hypothetical protein
VEPRATVFALGFDNQVHVRVLLMRVQRHGVSMLQREFLTGKGLGSGQDLLGRCRRRHGKHDVVDQFDGTAGLLLTARRAVLTCREFQMPVLDQFFLRVMVKALAFVRLNLEFAMLANVRNVRPDRSDAPSPAGHLDHDFRRSPNGAPDLLDLCCGEAARSVWAGTPGAEEIQERLARRRYTEDPLRHYGSPS